MTYKTIKINGNSFIGCALTLFDEGGYRVVFNDDKVVVHRDEIIP